MPLELRVILLALGLAGCAAQAPIVSSTPQQVGWKRLDETPAQGPLFQQAAQICGAEAARAANTGTSVLMQMMQGDATMKGCMAQKGYLPVFEQR